MNRKIPLQSSLFTWSIQYQMLLPLLAIATWLIFHQVTHYSVIATDQLDEDESRTPHLISTQLPNDWNEVTLPSLRSLASRYPGWSLFLSRGDSVVHSTVELDEWNQRFLGQLPPITYSSNRTRDFVIYDEYDTFWVAPVQTPQWPPDVHLIALHSREFANRADQKLETQIEQYGLMAVCGLLLLGGWYSRQLGLRVVRIQQQIRRIADGDLTSRIEDSRLDEVGDLALSVNTMADELSEMRARIQGVERNRLHSQLSSGVAHELRNGIHSARLSLEMFQDRCLKKRLSLPDEELLGISLEQLQVTESLVRRLLAIGKPQPGVSHSSMLSTLLNELTLLIAPIFEHAEIEFDVVRPEHLPDMIRDADAMHSALLNLCLNAVEAAGKGGQVRLIVEERNAEMTITVSDSGAGVDPAIAASLFEPFTTTKPEGIGLGLVLVRQAVHHEGGSVSWKREGGWTSFTLSLPRTDSPAETSAAAIAPEDECDTSTRE